MFTKAVIEEVISANRVRVRIPIFDKIASVTNSTPFEELSEATICTLPGAKDNCKVGDIVYVTFEDNDVGRPVVVGYLQREYDTGTLPSLKVGSFTAEGEVVLPGTTTIGNINFKNLSQLEELDENVQKTLDQLGITTQSTIDELREKTQDVVTKTYLEQNYYDKTETLTTDQIAEQYQTKPPDDEYFVTNEDLNSYATKDDLNDYVEWSELNDQNYSKVYDDISTPGKAGDIAVVNGEIYIYSGSSWIRLQPYTE